MRLLAWEQSSTQEGKQRCDLNGLLYILIRREGGGGQSQKLWVRDSNDQSVQLVLAAVCNERMSASSNALLNILRSRLLISSKSLERGWWRVQVCSQQSSDSCRLPCCPMCAKLCLYNMPLCGRQATSTLWYVLARCGDVFGRTRYERDQTRF